MGWLTPLEPQPRFVGKLLEIRVVCPQNGTAVLKGILLPGTCFTPIYIMQLFT